MQTEFRGKVSDWFGAKNTCVVLGPSILAFKVFLQASERVVDSTVEHHFASADC